MDPDSMRLVGEVNDMMSGYDLQAIAYIVDLSRVDVDHLNEVCSHFQNSCDKDCDELLCLLAVIMNLAGFTKQEKKLGQPHVKVPKILVQFFEDDPDIIRMRSLLVRLHRKFIPTSPKLYSKFVTNVCLQIKAHATDCKDGFELFKLMESRMAVQPDNMSCIEEALAGHKDFKNVLTYYKKSKAELLPNMEENGPMQPSHSTYSTTQVQSVAPTPCSSVLESSYSSSDQHSFVTHNSIYSTSSSDGDHVMHAPSRSRLHHYPRSASSDDSPSQDSIVPHHRDRIQSGPSSFPQLDKPQEVSTLPKPIPQSHSSNPLADTGSPHSSNYTEINVSRPYDIEPECVQEGSMSTYAMNSTRK